MNKKEEWIFTFCCGSENGGKCVRIAGSYREARDEMVARFGSEWAFQYPAEEWDEWKEDPIKAGYLEKEVDINTL